MRGSGEGEWCEEGWDSSTVIILIQKYFLHSLLLHKLSQSTNLASCSRVLCTGSDTAEIEKA